MSNYLKVSQKQQIYGLLQLGWSYRRIERETGVRRDSHSAHLRTDISELSSQLS